MALGARLYEHGLGITTHDIFGSIGSPTSPRFRLPEFGLTDIPEASTDSPMP
jgi:hypothetical protein